ncbi:MAG: hypothetical protein HYU59_15380 [Magnetospirillum gryphiswaldense]|uniref:hypothetical protein n=1 Tax=Magnetospirillum sp. 64-120 TaxID=1895778 RepID=UPI00092633C6|nr:hypothetical protein [Magnetospirillum sp. 64-120]MBI2242172.1 hypothetical protein [Magnetospirillum gryphiswaldense]OJX70446.1 MAG: hypothetical protein BGO92_17860 [Magnetospirillum sp. 64-120]
MENREMYDEINALVGAVAKAFDTSETEVITAIEQGRLGMEMLVDDEGRNYIQAQFDERSARIYPGAIFREDDDGSDVEAEDDGSCGGGCSCGH